MTEVITRRKMFSEHKFYITTNSFKSGDSWHNCLYIHFAKEDFPKLKYPELVKNDSPWMTNIKKRFDYSSGDLASLDWHWGITFYEEMYSLEREKTYVKAGCDFQHLYDEEYMRADCGKGILECHGEVIAKEFIEKFCQAGEL